MSEADNLPQKQGDGMALRVLEIKLILLLWVLYSLVHESAQHVKAHQSESTRGECLLYNGEWDEEDEEVPESDEFLHGLLQLGPKSPNIIPIAALWYCKKQPLKRKKKNCRLASPLPKSAGAAENDLDRNGARDEGSDQFQDLAPQLQVSLVFFYPASDGTKDESSTDHLEKSLSETLSRFYPLAGRFVSVDLCIDCNDEGVLYVASSINIELQEFLSKASKDMEVVNHIIPWDDWRSYLNYYSNCWGASDYVSLWRCGYLCARTSRML
ncbi:hypothetical protein RJ639_042339 [Escallonia herrerae]|uniref:Uncharacterized protein n=1 Tax=Escallonia herrerae TaxID=1293975 RepID=A0AA89B4L3_9ASTE|nr:hypothetical protein RJ639_042339 [Escallonia herrerae]